jgi:hypothetical protein
MKWIKLFENFSDEIVENNKMANDLVEDIKTISYLLEDEGFELKYSFGVKGGIFSVDEYNNYFVNNVSLQAPPMITNLVIKLIGNSITDPKTFQQTLTNKSKEIIERYIDLLKEHLDYINPDNISTERSLMGNINIIIRL